MVCHGPDPPENNEITPPPRHDLMINGTAEDSDDEHDYVGYEPLAQGPDAVHSDHDSEEDEEATVPSHIPNNVPNIEPMDVTLVQEVWSAPRPVDPIQMDNERAEEVMRAMANFALPQTSIPEWAQSISDEQWKQTLNERIEILRNNR